MADGVATPPTPRPSPPPVAAPGGSGVAAAGVWVIAALPLCALVFDPGGWRPFGVAKFTAIAVPPLLVAVVQSFGASPMPLVRDAWGRAWGLVGIAVAVSTIFALDDVYAVIGTPERRFGFLAWVLLFLAFAGGRTATMSSPRQGWYVAAGMAAAVGVAGSIALAEALGWELVELDNDSDRLVGPFGSAAFLGAFTVLGVPAAAGLVADTDRSRLVRAVAAVAVGLGAVALVGSQSRAAVVGVGAVVVVAAARFRHRRSAPGRAALVAATASLAAVLVVVATPLGGRLADTFDADGGASGRIDEWQVGLGVWSERPLTGVGPEGYRLVSGAHIDADYERAHGRDVLADRAHSSVIDVLATLGVFGLAAVAGLWWLAARVVAVAVRVGRPWQIGVALGLVGWWVQSLFLFPTVEVDVVAWGLLGALAGSMARRDRPTDPRHGSRWSQVGRWTGAGVAAVALSVVVSAGLAGIRADRAAREALDALAVGDVGVAADRAGDAVTLRSDVLVHHLLAARVANTSPGIAAVDVALAHVDDALDLSPRDPIARERRADLLTERAALTGSTTDVEAARRAWDELVTDDPNHTRLQLGRGLAAALAGEVGVAESAWRRAADLSPGDPEPPARLATLYLDEGRLPAARVAVDRVRRLDPAHPALPRLLDTLADATRAAG